MPMPWWKHTITQRFKPGVENGIDIGMAPHTLLTALWGGRVISSSYGPWGGDLKIQIAPGIFEEYLHPDLILAKVGDIIKPGQVVALSGGQNVGGYHPASPRFSSGPHTEFDINIGGKYRDPFAIINGLRTGAFQAPTLQESSSPGGLSLTRSSSPAVTTGSGGGLTLTPDTQVNLPGGPWAGLGDIVHQAGQTITTTAEDWATRFAIIGVAFVLLIIGLLVFFLGGSGRAATGAVVTGAAGGVGRAIAARGKAK